MGVRVTRADGENLGYGGALARTFLVVMLGLGFYVPVVSFIAMLLQFSRVSNGQRAAWDDILRLQVTHVERPPLLWIALIVAMFATHLALRWEEIAARVAQGAGD